MANEELKYNPKSPAVKRLMREAMELSEPDENLSARPCEDNLFEWHFTIKGAPDTDFDGGVYHGRMSFPTEYPMKPPHIILHTPNGRFETNKKICLSISGHHPETWLPSWSIRTALVALIAFMPTPSKGTVGSLDYTREERQILARKSTCWECQQCGYIKDLLRAEQCQNQDHQNEINNNSSTLFPLAPTADATVIIENKDDTDNNIVLNNVQQPSINRETQPTTTTNEVKDVNSGSNSVNSSSDKKEEGNPSQPGLSTFAYQPTRCYLSSLDTNYVIVAVMVAIIAFLIVRRIFFA